MLVNSVHRLIPTNLGWGQDGENLDALMGERFAELDRTSSAYDRQQLADYSEAVRDLERQLQSDQEWVNRPKPVVDEPAPSEGYPSPFANRADTLGRARIGYIE